MRDLHVIIPAGGAGTRLWPLSRAERPKFLLDLLGTGRSLLQATVDRLEPVAATITVVTGQAHTPAVRAQLPEGQRYQVITEPSGRDSMAAIGLAAAIIRARHGNDALIGSCAADHAIAHPDELLRCITQACEAARGGYITTIGITPTHASTAYGYIAPGQPLNLAGTAQPNEPVTHSGGGFLVTQFVEKPDTATAQRYLAQGYLWNAGMFIMRAGTLLDHLERLHPDIAEHLDAIAGAWDTPEREAALATHWEAITRIAIDHAIAEPVAADGGVAVVPSGDLGWTDIGDFAALHTMTGDGDALRIDAPGNYVHSTTGQKIALLGVECLSVIVTDDAILVTCEERAQGVKQVVDHLKAHGETSLT